MAGSGGVYVRSKKSAKGFSLMEMLIVVAIMAVLVGIAIPTFSGSVAKAKAAACAANRRSLKAQLTDMELLDGYASLEAAAESSEGAAALKSCTCPLGGTIYIEEDQVLCTKHLEESTDSSLAAMIATVNAIKPKNWQDAVAALAGDGTD